jgi:hypothetical protein
MSMMYQLISKQGEMSMSDGEVGVDAQAKAQQTDEQRQESALKQEEADEASVSHGFWADVGHDFEKVAEYVGIAAAVVGAAVVTVASCGTAGIAVAAVVIGLSATGMVAAKTGCFGKDSEFIGLGLEIASAVVSFGASSAMAASAALQSVTAVADGVSGASDVVAGAASVVVGHEQADVVDDSADVQQALNALTQNARVTADLLNGLKATQQSNKNALQVLGEAAHTYDQTLTLASAAKG